MDHGVDDALMGHDYPLVCTLLGLVMILRQNTPIRQLTGVFCGGLL